MLARVAHYALALLLAANGLQVDPHPPSAEPRLGQAGKELLAASRAEAAGEADRWPWSHRRKDPEPSGRLAVLLSGQVERLLLSPLLSHVVRANAQDGLQVDLYLGLQAAASAELEASVDKAAADPKISQLLRDVGAGSFNGSVMERICQMAMAQLASSCHYDLETDGPPPDGARQKATAASFSTSEGKAAVARWRTQSRLWDRALAQEGGRKLKYDAVMVARADDFWMSPSVVDVGSFRANPRMLSMTPCATGVGDKAAVMGREAAEAMLQLYQAWQRADPELEGAQTAEQAWQLRASRSGVAIVAAPKQKVASVSYTQSGLPCFRAQACAAGLPSGLLAKFSCEERSPAIYDLLWPQQVQKLHQMLADLAGHQERKPVVITVIDDNELDLAFKMVRSLQAAGEGAGSSLVVGTVPGVCRDMESLYGVSNKRCLIVQPARDVRRGVFKHAVLATAALAGLSDRLMYVSPRVAFAKAPNGQLWQAASGRQVVFGRSGMAAAEGVCGDAAKDSEPGSPASVLDSSIISLSDAPEVAGLLLRTWARMEESEDASQQASFAGAVQERADGVEAVVLPCGAAKLQETDKVEPSESTMLTGLEIGAKPPPRPVQPRVKRAAAEGEDSHEANEDSRPMSSKEMWAKRIKDLEEENGYNETAAREEAAARRRENRALKKNSTTHKKHVRYLPPEEAAKVKARDEKWEAQQEKQRMEDLEHKEERAEAFKREVEKAARIISGGSEDEDASGEGAGEEDTGAA